MLVRLMYASRATGSAGHEELAVILKKARANNAAAGVTGVLCASDGVFVQVLEGGRGAVSAIYNRIAQDPRHRDVTLLGYGELDERSFAGWFMGHVDLSRLNPAVLLKYSDTARLDPFAVSGKMSMALFEELVATASVNCAAQ